ncbi:unnamed protein product [Brachionus calyciflorus]|uniref:Homeobox domain-containing protein n=1 Tax=Brachionus calyciflorus TaxID=104777 RepID=A0A814AFT8_9BILA|nr:unnamed protein product [Brachionus calyciflorus]
MNRYQDNISPEPNGCVNLNDCYKTPNLQQYYNINQLYPTPPSDNETSPLNDNICKLSPDGLVTPNLSYYDQNSFNNESHDGSLYRPNNTEDKNYCKNLDAQNNQQQQQQVASRFKRRSRTTYTKSQLDALEATFQKTHYPEIRVVDDLSSMLNLSTERISIWFQNRRARFKKARKLETKENLMESSNPCPSFSLSNAYQNSNTYSQINLNAKTEQFPLNRNLLNSFTPVQEKQSVPLAFSNTQLNPIPYYNQFNMTPNNLTSNPLPFYQPQISQNSLNGSYYQSAYPMVYPSSYSSNGLQ